MDGKVVFQGKTKGGRDLIIRYLTNSDSEELMAYINTLSKEQTYIRWQGEQITLPEEQRYIDFKIDRIRKNFCVQLVACVENKIVGTSDIDLMNMTESHVGIFGITIAKESRGEGIGSVLLNSVLKEAEKNIPLLRIVTLKVYVNNPVAIKMYERAGFIKYGVLPEGVHYKGGYIDEILMYKNIR